MALDITLLFKASVKSVEGLNRAVGDRYHSPKNNILKCTSSSRPESGFSPEARAVIANITKLKDFLLHHRKDYVNAGSLTSTYLAGMTDGERDKIDRDAQIFMRTCSEAIKRLRVHSEKQAASAQLKQHKEAVLDMVETYLKGVCKLYSEQRAIRFRRAADKRRLLRLQPEHRGKTEKSHTPPSLAEERARGKGLPMSPPSADPWEEEEEGGMEDELSPEEIQTYKQENQRMVSEMSSMADECRHMEGNVVEISRLQEIFSEEILQQEMEIDSIHQVVVGATEMVKEGNEGIRAAIRNDDGLRLWILFFLVMCSLCLLFLDWYSG